MVLLKYSLCAVGCPVAKLRLSFLPTCKTPPSLKECESRAGTAMHVSCRGWLILEIQTFRFINIREGYANNFTFIF